MRIDKRKEEHNSASGARAAINVSDSCQSVDLPSQPAQNRVSLPHNVMDGFAPAAVATRHGGPISLTLVERPAPTRESKAAAAAAAFPSSWASSVSSSERAHLMLPFPSLSLITHFFAGGLSHPRGRGRRLHRSGFLRRPDDGGGRGARRRHRAHAPGRPCKHTSTRRRGAQGNVACHSVPSFHSSRSV